MRAERALGEYIDVPPKAPAERSFKSDKFEKRAAFFHFDKQIDIAGFSLSAAGERSEDADVLRTVLPGFRKDNLPGSTERIYVSTNSVSPTKGNFGCHYIGRIAHLAIARVSTVGA